MREQFPHRYGYRVYSTYLHIIHNFTSHYVAGSFGQGDREGKAEKAKKALGSVATLNVDKEDETPAGNAPAPAGIVDIVNTATGESVMNDWESLLRLYQQRLWRHGRSKSSCKLSK